MQKAEQETVTVSREILSHMVSDIEHLIDDIEMIVDRGSMKIIDKRLKDVKESKVKGLSETDFKDFMRKEGIDAG